MKTCSSAVRTERRARYMAASEGTRAFNLYIECDVLYMHKSQGTLALINVTGIHLALMNWRRSTTTKTAAAAASFILGKEISVWCSSSAVGLPLNRSLSDPINVARPSLSIRYGLAAVVLTGSQSITAANVACAHISDEFQLPVEMTLL